MESAGAWRSFGASVGLGVLLVAGCGVDVKGLGSAISSAPDEPAAPPASAPSSGNDAPSFDAGAEPAGSGSGSGSPSADPGPEDASSEPPPTPRDYLAFGTFKAEWWNKSRGPNGCDDGRAFGADGGIAAPPLARTNEPLILFPRLDHPTWTSVQSAPVPGVTRDFCARFTQKVKLPEGSFTIAYKKDDGVRVYVDDELVVDDWRFDSTNERTVRWTNAEEGERTVTIVFHDGASEALLYVKLLK